MGGKPKPPPRPFRVCTDIFIGEVASMGYDEQRAFINERLAGVVASLQPMALSFDGYVDSGGSMQNRFVFQENMKALVKDRHALADAAAVCKALFAIRDQTDVSQPLCFVFQDTRDARPGFGVSELIFYLNATRPDSVLVALERLPEFCRARKKLLSEPKRIPVFYDEDRAVWDTPAR